MCCAGVVLFKPLLVIVYCIHDDSISCYIVDVELWCYLVEGGLPLAVLDLPCSPQPYWSMPRVWGRPVKTAKYNLGGIRVMGIGHGFSISLLQYADYLLKEN